NKEYPQANVCIIDFKTEAHVRKYNIFPKFRRNIVRYFYELLAVLYRYKLLKKRVNLFAGFIKDELKLTRRFKDVEDLLTNIPKLDMYIVGSDQVFHPGSPYLRVFYMDFSKGSSLKIAYAPSFGSSDFSSEVQKKIESYLKD